MSDLPSWCIETKSMNIYIQRDGVSARCHCHIDTNIQIRKRSYQWENQEMFEILMGGEYQEHRMTENYAIAQITRENLIKLRDEINQKLEEGEA